MSRLKLGTPVLAASFAVLTFGAAPAHAVDYSFACISNNSGNCSSVAPQMSVSVSGAGNDVAFMFTNAGPIASSITDIYFDTDLALSTGTITNGAGVSFDWGASPPDLPGGNNVGFTASFAADSNSPATANGVNPGEAVTLAFTGLGAYSSVLSALSSGSFNIGLHVQSIAPSLNSDAMVLQVPEPETYTLLLAGLGVLGFLARRRRAD